MWHTRCFTCYDINKFTCAKSTLEHTHIVGILFTEYICNPIQAKDFLDSCMCVMFLSSHILISIL